MWFQSNVGSIYPAPQTSLDFQEFSMRFQYRVQIYFDKLSEESFDIEDAMQGQGEPWRSGLPPFFANLGSGLFV